MIGKLVVAAAAAVAVSSLGGAGYVTILHNLRPALEVLRAPVQVEPIPYLTQTEGLIPLVCTPAPALAEAAPEPPAPPPRVIPKPVAPAQTVPRKRI